MPLSKEDYNLYDEFIQKFSTEKLSSLSLDNYSNFNNDSFCYWIENKLNNWGDIHGATSYNFGIYRWKDDPKNKKARGADSDDKYAWLIKYGKTANEAYNNILKMIIQIANYAKEGKIEEIDKIDISEMFKWKIAFLYSDKKLINWFSKDILVGFVNYLGGEVNNQTPTSDLQRFLLRQKGEKSLEIFNEELHSIKNSLSENDLKGQIGGKQNMDIKTIKQELKNKLPKDKYKVTKDSSSDGDYYIWVGTIDSLIGDSKLFVEEIKIL